MARAQDRGFIGAGELGPHVELARWSGEVVARHLAAGDAPPTVVDLGSGGGLPGLVLAAEWPAWRVVLVEAMGKRATHLAQAVEELGATQRVTVLHERAEVTGRRPELRGHADAVVARAFGPPAVVAECAAPLLRVGGVLVVNEPPDRSPRWPAPELAVLGLEPHEVADAGLGAVFVARQVTPCPDRFPRGVGRPAKRPLF